MSRPKAVALGLTKYFTGKPCPKGHVAPRWTSGYCCTLCNLENGADWKRKNRAKVRAQVRARYAANPGKYRSARINYYWSDPEKARTAARSWYWKNPEAARASDRRYRNAHPEAKRDAKARWDAANRERIAAYDREWREKNREKELVKQRRRRSRLLAAAGSHSADDIGWLWKIQRGRCAHEWCRAKLSTTCLARGRKADPVDHIVPLARGGTNNRRNLQLLCRSCNSSKGAKHPIDFAQQHGMLV